MHILASYTRKWFVYIISFFLFFVAVLVVFEYIHERKFRIQVLNEKLSNYGRVVYHYSMRNSLFENNDFKKLDGFIPLVSDRSIRYTLMRKDGKVLYDSWVKNTTRMENHLMRPEVQKCLKNGFGSGVRISATTGVKYYYLAIEYDQCIVRVSDVFNLSVSRFVRPGRINIVILTLLLFIASIIIIYINDKVGRSIHALKQFALKAMENKPLDEQYEFAKNELGEIGQEIIDIYKKLNTTKEELISEKTKLIRHLNLLEEGIAIFSKEKQAITSNNNFIRFINYISDTRVFTPDEFFRIEGFGSIFKFINKYLADNQLNLNDNLPTYEISVSRGDRFFSVKSIVFQDKSFEISINDVSRPTKRKILKQQLTENIAHELKTPVSSIKGFLETILEAHPDKIRTMNYLKRAYSQSCRLADLVNDISLLTKIEEAGSLYKIEESNLSELLNEIISEVQPRLAAKELEIDLRIPHDLSLFGNTNLLYSIFRNLLDNSINHAGEDIRIRLENYLQDDEFYYFIYSDSGVGVPEEDLPRLFERFYRVDKGRDRKNGGTGLGLAIVKNAIQFHKGDITVRNRQGGGLEFLFTLAKDARSSQK
jgi:two-component system, OmpR family, phosphate regulon sensor histidine kinase PhoR